MKSLIAFLWQLPQNLLGWFIVKVVNKKNFCKADNGCYRVKHLADCGISLGHYVIIDQDIYLSAKTFNHEKGHQIQSKYLGWLYLPTIGLLSLVGNVIDRFFHKQHERKGCWYYKQPWEWWADKLGGVER